MHELIINKLYENGKIDDPLKSRFTDDIYDSERPLMQHALLKIINAFMKFTWIIYILMVKLNTLIVTME